MSYFPPLMASTLPTVSAFAFAKYQHFLLFNGGFSVVEKDMDRSVCICFWWWVANSHVAYRNNQSPILWQLIKIKRFETNRTTPSAKLIIVFDSL